MLILDAQQPIHRCTSLSLVTQVVPSPTHTLLLLNNLVNKRPNPTRKEDAELVPIMKKGAGLRGPSHTSGGAVGVR